MPNPDDPRDQGAPRPDLLADLLARLREEPTEDTEEGPGPEFYAGLDAELDEDSDEPGAPAISAGLDEEDYLDDDDDFPLGDGVADTTAEVWCPYCGEPSEIAVDPGGGDLQHYVEDCPVCCRPWQVTVHFASDGTVTVACDADDASMDDLD